MIIIIIVIIIFKYVCHNLTDVNLQCENRKKIDFRFKDNQRGRFARIFHLDWLVSCFDYSQVS